jgi:hypothetical protein
VLLLDTHAVVLLALAEPMSPASKAAIEQEAVLERTLKRLSRGWSLGGSRLDRASLYDR